MKLIFNQKTQEINQGIIFKLLFQEQATDNPYGFKGKVGQVKPESNILFIGAGEQAKWNEKAARKIGCLIAENIQTKPIITIDLTGMEHALETLIGFYLRYWNFTKYRTNTLDAHQLYLETANIVCDENIQKAFEEILPVLNANQWCRSICEEPANVCNSNYMEEMAKMIPGIIPGVTLKVLNKPELEALGMNALLEVNAGSKNPAKLLVIEHMKGKENEKPYAFVGKGVTFDTGGISIKPSANMDEMKKDMSGAAAVLGLMRALSENNVQTNVVGIIPVVENMPDGAAQRPGDVWKTANGQTIEVLNTDAEGRLILCDALWYAQKTYNPEFVIDFATLTGAILIALGKTFAGLYVNDKGLEDSLKKAGEETGEELWTMPLHPDFDSDVNSVIADIANIGQSSPYGGSNTAAAFLARFINKDVKWAHIDIAGTAYTKKTSFCAGPGSTGYGVRLAYQWIINRLS